MDITYLGGGGVRLVGRDVEVVCDPIVGVKTKGDVVTWSATGGEEAFGRPADAMLFDTPGEYEVRGATIVGVPARLHIDEGGHRGTAFSVVIDGVNVVVTGNLSGKLDDDQVENLGQIDVLVVPVGGHGLTLDAEGAAALVTQLEPSYVIPVHYDDGVTEYPVPQDNADPFLKEMGSTPEAQSKFRLTSKEAPSETQVILLNRAGSS